MVHSSAKYFLFTLAFGFVSGANAAEKVSLIPAPSKELLQLSHELTKYVSPEDAAQLIAKTTTFATQQIKEGNYLDRIALGEKITLEQILNDHTAAFMKELGIDPTHEAEFNAAIAKSFKETSKHQPKVHANIKAVVKFVVVVLVVACLLYFFIQPVEAANIPVNILGQPVDFMGRVIDMRGHQPGSLASGIPHHTDVLGRPVDFMGRVVNAR